MIDDGIFSQIFVVPTLNILLLFHRLFSLIKLPGAFGFSIIGLTLFIRFLLSPLNKKQTEMTRKLNELKPEIEKLEKKYKNDKNRLQQEQLKLYQQAGINPGVGCLLPFIQLPFFIGLYNVLSVFLIKNNKINPIDLINKNVYFSFLKISNINSWFFGFNLALSPQKSGSWYYLFIPLITAFLQYLQIEMMTPKTKESEDKKDKKNENEDVQKMMNIQMKLMMPAFIGWFAYTLPVGLSLYWNIFSIFGIFQAKKLSVKN